MTDFSALSRRVAFGQNPAQAVLSDDDGSLGIDQKVYRWRQLQAASYGMTPELFDLTQLPGVTDVVINGLEVWLDRGNGMERSEWAPANIRECEELARKIAAAGGKRLDEASPLVDAIVGTNMRFHAVLPPLAQNGPAISLRILRSSRFSLEDLETHSTVSPDIGSLLRYLVDRGGNMLISGATGAGKTTLLDALLSLVPEDERIICIEEVSELAPTHPHVIHLQERRPNVEGMGAVSLSDLVRAALRMRPNWIVLGECRGVEVVDVLSALNTGHKGFATIHANNVHDVPARLAALGAKAGLGSEALGLQTAAAFDVVLHMRRSGAQRELAEVGVLSTHGGQCEPALVRRGMEMVSDVGYDRLCEVTGWNP
ncbi:TadA family conjugal transfer-associated ATPase [Actinomycetaceae bacterium WB03_NA08]|uniref:TadA family conjugal transfer-associated ATPase n=1 Tax=Scrofimicrobium canadense TaxID=2652290 RepID=A0A6N7VNK7_9ACTO|nr:TadA family conjugal transfer-associated ATPase [Scrofimicrobium canadense]MSS83294.1 TadA family conjugal transfer-associated ATPase [Scrofimicrobium canadense]